MSERMLEWKKLYSENLLTGKHRWWRPFQCSCRHVGLQFFQKGLPHKCFSRKFVKFYRTSFLQNNAARLLLVSYSIFNVSLALPVINRWVIAWRYNISIISVLISALYYYISINIISLVSYLHGHCLGLSEKRSVCSENI